MKRILVCTDGEAPAVRAEELALDLAGQGNGAVTGLYVLDPFLKKFTHEIYAVNRNECRAHLDACLLAEGEAALAALATRCAARGVAFEARLRRGDVAEEIVAEAAQGYDLLVLGAPLLDNWRRRLASRDAPRRVFQRVTIPALFVR